MGRPPDENTLMSTYRDTVGPLYAFVSGRCGGDRSLAEDITQETWLRAVNSWRRKGLPDEPLAWLVTVARNLIINNFRRVQPLPLDSLPPGWEPGVLDNGFEIDTPEVAALVNWGLSQLSPRQAKLLEAFHLNGRKVAEIAVETGLSERAIEGRLRRARLKLRQHIQSVMKN